jgi:hypothetical protein
MCELLLFLGRHLSNRQLPAGAGNLAANLRRCLNVISTLLTRLRNETPSYLLISIEKRAIETAFPAALE